MADITFIVTDSSMKYDYLFIGSKLLKITFSEVEIIGNTFYWLTSLFTGCENVCTGSDHFSLA